MFMLDGGDVHLVEPTRVIWRRSRRLQTLDVGMSYLLGRLSWLLGTCLLRNIENKRRNWWKRI
jgi:hypothetical protein